MENDYAIDERGSGKIEILFSIGRQSAIIHIFYGFYLHSYILFRAFLLWDEKIRKRDSIILYDVTFLQLHLTQFYCEC